MPEISKITLPSGTTYDIKDATARATAAGAIQLKGVTTTELVDEATTNPIQIGGKSYTAIANDAVFYGKAEFVFDGTMWHEFGDMSGVGDMGKVDEGTVTVSFSDTAEDSAVSFAAHTTDSVLGADTTFTNGASAVTFTGGTSDSVLGADTTFTAADSAVSFTGGTNDSVLGADTTFTNSTSAVSFGNHTTATVLTSSTTGTVPKTVASTKYLTASSSVTAADGTLGSSTTTKGDNTVMWDADVTNETLSFVFKPLHTDTLSPSVTLTAGSTTSTGAVTLVESISESGTNDVTFSSNTTADAITALGTATAAAQTITVGSNDAVTAITGIGTGTAAAQEITVGTNDAVTAITGIGTGTAAAQTITVGTNDAVNAITALGAGTAAGQAFSVSDTFTVYPKND